jgi:hypothetical protein
MNTPLCCLGAFANEEQYECLKIGESGENHKLMSMTTMSPHKKLRGDDAMAHFYRQQRRETHVQASLWMPTLSLWLVVVIAIG